MAVYDSSNMSLYEYCTSININNDNNKSDKEYLGLDLPAWQFSPVVDCHWTMFEKPSRVLYWTVGFGYFLIFLVGMGTNATFLFSQFRFCYYYQLQGLRLYFQVRNNIGCTLTSVKIIGEFSKELCNCQKRMKLLNMLIVLGKLNNKRFYASYFMTLLSSPLLSFYDISAIPRLV